jgi:acetolactate synthase-1/2/3 large subunit
MEILRREEVEVVFGYPGGKVLTLYDALYEYEFPHVLNRHEQGAAHAADGYARSTGKVGVCFSTSGPGATNLVTGIATAHMDSAPLVAITGQVANPLIGKDSFQEADICGITTPVTKHNYLVKDIADLPRVLKEAFYIARTGRPGPVLVDIAQDVFAATLDYEYPERVSFRGYQPIGAGEEKAVAAVAAALKIAKKPVIFIGGGVILSETAAEIKTLIEKTGIPVTSTLMALGAVPYDHPLNLEMIGMHGSYAANMAVTESDLLLGIGVRFDDRVTSILSGFAPNARIAHFDIDPAEINKNIRVDFRVVGDLAWSLPELLRQIEQQDLPVWRENWREWAQKTRRWKESKPFAFHASEQVIMPQEAVKAVSRQAREDAIVVTDVGQHQMWVAQYYPFRLPRTILTSGGLGTMGYGLPAALGAQVGNPERQVVLFAGDGGLMMNIQELATIGNLNLPVKIVVMNNEILGMIAQWQRLFYGGRLSQTSLKGRTDFVKLAEAMGVKGLRVSEPAKLEETLKEAFAFDGPVLIDVLIPDSEDVYPMVYPNARLDQMNFGE